MIEADYTFNEGSQNAFTFQSKPIDETLKSIDSGDIWISGIWANGYRTALRSNNSWENPGYANTSDTAYSVPGTEYSLRLEVSPVKGMTLSVRKATDADYTVLQTLSVAEMEAADASLADCLDGNVRMVVQCLCDVTIDSLKVRLMEPEENALYYNDFEAESLAALENEELAEAVFGEGNYLLGHAKTDASLRIEDGGLRIIGDDNVDPGDGTTKNNRTQILLANDERISEQGVVIEADYTFNEGSQNAFTFQSNPIDETLKTIDSGKIWISGIWAKGYRTCLRTKGAWNNPGKLDQSDTAYSAAGTEYNLKLVVSPTEGMTLSAKKAADSEYTVLQALSVAEMEAAGGAYGECLNDYVRLVIQCNCDVTLDNLKVSLLNPETEEPEEPVEPEDGVLFYNDFENLNGLENEELAEAVFGEGNYLPGHAKTDASLRIEDGGLRIIGDDNVDPGDGTTKNNRTQILLANDERISEQGVVIEADYILNAGSKNAFTFASKPIDETLKSIESGDVWLSGIWSGAGYRTSLRCTANNNSWENPGLVNSSDRTYSTLGTAYNLKLEVSPTRGITLSARKDGDSAYTVLQALSIETIEAAGVSLADCLDDNVRLIVQCQCDVTLDNLKVSLLNPETEEPDPEEPDPEEPGPEEPEESFWFDNDFNDASLSNLEGEALAEAIFGEGNYILGHAATDATMKIENGALRIIGDDNGTPTDGETKNNRTQILLARHEDISDKGAVIEVDYTLKEGSSNAFTFASKPIDETFKSIESGNVWISGIWTNAGYRTSLRCTATENSWTNPGIANTADTTYSSIGTAYNLRIVVSPTDGIKLYAKRSTSSSYALLADLTTDMMNAAGSGLYAECLDDNIRLIVQCNCDVLLDNLKVYSAEEQEPGEDTPSTEVGFFSSDFNDPALANLTDEELAAALFGEGNYLLGQAQTNATLRIENGALRLIGDNNVEPTDGRTKVNRTQFLLASNDQVSDGVVIECDYILNSGSQSAFTFASKPIDETFKSIDSGNVWISGIWTNAGYRASLRCTANENSWTNPGIVDSSDITYSSTGTAYNLRIVVSPTDGIKLYAKRSTSSSYALLADLTTETMNAAGSSLYAECLDDNVRLILQCNCDVTLDNLKVYPLSEASEDVVSPSTEVGFFSSDFNDASIANLTDEALAAALFGEGNYLLGQAETNATLRIENGALRLIGDNNVDPTDGRTRVNRTQFLLASNGQVSDGVVIECDYIINAGSQSQSAFTFASKPIVSSGSIDGNDVWISGIWTNAGYRASLRCRANENSWTNPGIVDSINATYSSVGTPYKLRLVVSPTDGIKLYAKRSGSDSYALLANLTTEMMNEAGSGLFAECLDDNVRLILQCNSDVTIDNLNVYPISEAAPEVLNHSTEVDFFDNDFNSASLAGLTGADLAVAIFGEGNYLLGQAQTDATLRIENGALRLIGDNNVEPTDGRTKINRTQFLLASNDQVSKGVVIECDYRLNSGSKSAFTFASKPVSSTNIENNVWIAGIWSNDKSRTAMRDTDGVGKDWSPLAYSDNLETCGKIGVNYKLRLEVDPEEGLTMYAKREGDADYVRLGTWTDDDVATFKGSAFDCLDDNVRLILQCETDVTIDNLKVTPLAEAEEMEVSDVEFYFYNDFNDEDLAGLTGEELAEAIFGEDHYLLGHALTDATLSIENGALRLVGDDNEDPEDGIAKNNRTQFLLASHPDISSEGVVIECDYTFNPGATSAFTFASRGLITSNDPAKVPSGIETNVWIAGMWAEDESRTAVRYPSDWKPIAYGPTADMSGEIGTTYHMKLEVSPTEGLALYAKTSLKGEYKRLGTWSEDDIALFTGEYKNSLDDNVRLILQCNNDVTIDNLVVYPLGMDYEPYVEEVRVMVNGEYMMLTVGEWDLSTLVDGEFLFAVVDGRVTTNPIVNITSDTKVIDIYTLTLDTLDGAALRTTGTAALRWMTKVSTAEYDALMAAVENGIIKSFEVGTLTTKWENLGYTEMLDLDQLENGAVAQVFDGEWIESDAYGDVYLYAGATEDIDEENYNIRYCGVGYGTVTLNNNQKLTVYGGFDRYVHARSVSQVASTAYLDENSGLTKAQQRAIKPCAVAYAGAESVDGVIRTLDLAENGASNYEIVVGRNASAAESAAASQLRTALGTLTGVFFTINTDSRYKEDAYQIVVGNTQFAESEEALSNLNKNQSGVKVVGNKIIINSYTDSMLQEAIREWETMLEEYVVQEEDGTKTLVASTKEEVRMTDESILLDIPEFKGGTYEAVYESGNNNMQLVYTEVDASRIDAYLTSLAEAGFEVKEDNTIGKNRFVTCLGEAGLVHLSYFSYTGSLSITTDTLAETTYKETEPEYEKVTDTTLAVMSLDYSHRSETDGNGESYVITLEDGRYIIIDGGYMEDAEGLYQFLVDNNKRSDGKVVIAAWFLSHSHGDHYGCFGQFTSAYSSEVTLEYLVAAPGISAMYSNGYDDYLTTNLARIAEETYQCQLIRPHTGQILTFCNTQFQILYTLEDYALRYGYGTITSENNASLVFKMTANGQTVLFTNDAEKAVSQLLCDTYGEELKSDIFQMNHHGVGGCIKRLCEYVDPEYSLWTTNQISYDLRVSREIGGIDQYESNLYILEKLGRENCFIADGDVEIISFPLEDKATDITYYTMQ